MEVTAGTDKMFVRERDFIILMGVDVLVCIRLISESSSSSTSYSLWQFCIGCAAAAAVVVVDTADIDFREEFLTGVCCCLFAFFVFMGGESVLRKAGTIEDGDVVLLVLGVTTMSFSSLNCVRGATVAHLEFDEILLLYEPADLRS